MQFKLKERGIPSMVYYLVSLHQQLAYKDKNQNSFPVTEKLSNTVLSLPIHTEIRSVDQEFIISSFFEILNI